MTIASQTSRISYTGDGSTTAFAVPFFFASNSDLVVYLTDTGGNIVLQVLGTNYSLSGAGLSAGGTCTFTTAPTTGYIIAIYRDPPLTQTTSYNNNDPFPAKSHEAALDKGVTIDQRTRDLVTRSARLNDADPTASMTVPSLPIRKGKIAGYSATDGSMVVSNNTLATLDSVLSGALATSGGFNRIVLTATLAALKAMTPFAGAVVFMQGYAANNDGGEGVFIWNASSTATPDIGTIIQPNAGGVGRWIRQVTGAYSVLWFGADRTGATDAAAAIRATMAAVNALGSGAVYIPSGTYLLSTSAVLNFIIAYSNVTLYGDGDGTLLKVANAMNPLPGQTWGFTIVGQVNQTDVISNFQLRNLKVDMNGANNGGHIYQNQLVEIDYGNNIIVENCCVINHPGSQIIVLGSAGEPPHMKQVRVIGNRFNNVGYPVNATMNDHSSIYINADDYVVSQNVGINTAAAPLEGVAVITLVECHGTNWVASHNVADNYTRVGNIAADVGNCIDGQFVHNSGRGLRCGVVGFNGAGNTMDQLIVADNTFRLLTQTVAGAIDFVTSFTASSLLGSLDIHDNDIWCAVADNDASSTFAGIFAGFFDTIRITGNSMRHLSGPGIEIGPLSSTTKITILNNVMGDCGRTSVAASKKGIRASNATPGFTLTIGGNQIINSTTGYAAIGVDIALSGGVTGGRIQFTDTFVNVTTAYSIVCAGLLPNGFATAQPAVPATGVGNKVTNSNSYPVRVHPVGSVDLRLIDRNGSSAAVGNVPTITLLPGESVWANTTAPTSWTWEGL